MLLPCLVLTMNYAALTCAMSCRFCVEADLETRATLPVPHSCPARRSCNGTSFRPVDGMQLLTDYQEVRNVQQASGARMSLNTESAAQKGVGCRCVCRNACSAWPWAPCRAPSMSS